MYHQNKNSKPETKKVSQETLQEIKSCSIDRAEDIFYGLGFCHDDLILSPFEIRCKCPIHDGDNPTSFCYYPETATWRCYSHGCHDEIGDSVFSLVQSVLQEKNQDKQIGFRDSVYWLANLLGIDVGIEGQTVVSDEDREVMQLVREARAKAGFNFSDVQICRQEFVPKKVEEVRQFIKPSKNFLEKGFSEETLRKFMVGYCDTFGKPMYRRDYAPVLDETGEMVVGATGRSIYPRCEYCGFHHLRESGCPNDNPAAIGYPKWKHYGFQKKYVVYNYHNARPWIEKTGVAVVFEGPKEVWWADQHGIKNSICLFGLYMNKYRLNKLLEAGARTLVIALDNDEEGQKAQAEMIKSVSDYFRIVNINQFLKSGQDLADVSSESMTNQIVPFIQSLSENYG